MSLPLSLLENILHPKQISFDENYLIELNNGEVVTLGDLTNFWIEGHQKIKNALDIIKESKKEVCNMTGENISTQNQTTGKKSRKSIKKMTTSQK